ncbi:MAG: hypothetical protein KBH45_17440 [Verrucomicrobia bacterium]|nr:hypothetical protein [Verrucomicrobiota bacterium]
MTVILSAAKNDSRVYPPPYGINRFNRQPAGPTAVHACTYFMDNPQFQQHGGPHAAAHRPHRKPLHHSPFFWLAAVCILIAMTIYVLTNNLSTGPDHKPVPAVVP